MTYSFRLCLTEDSRQRVLLMPKPAETTTQHASEIAVARWNAGRNAFGFDLLPAARQEREVSTAQQIRRRGNSRLGLVAEGK